MKAVVVGTGITGCVSAIKLKKSGFDVDVYDAAHSIGGVLNDVEIEGEYYYNGCQYLNSHASWLKEIIDESLCDFKLHAFPHSYGSYTDIAGTELVNDSFAGPVFNLSLKDVDLLISKPNNLYSRLLNYPPDIASSLIQWASQYADINEDIYRDCAIGMQLSRVYLDYDDEQLLQLKKDKPLLDELYGLPRSVISPDEPIVSASLPKYGFKHFFELLAKEMRAMKIKFFHNSPVTPKSNENLQLYCRQEKIVSDLVVWTGNPVPIIMQAGFGKLDNPSCMMRLFFCDIKCGEELNIGHYIQVYGRETSITRIYIYQYANAYKATIEGFNRKELNIEKVIEEAEMILQKSGFNIKLNFKDTVKQKRYIFYTNDDIKKIQSFNDFASDNNIIPGAWEYFPRDEKIETIFENIERFCA